MLQRGPLHSLEAAPRSSRTPAALFKPSKKPKLCLLKQSSSVQAYHNRKTEMVIYIYAIHIKNTRLDKYVRHGNATWPAGARRACILAARCNFGPALPCSSLTCLPIAGSQADDDAACFWRWKLSA